MAWTSAGVQTNPAIDTILADSGPVQVGASGAKIIFGSGVAAIVTVEYRNAANNANNQSQILAVAANQVIDMDFPYIPFAANERIRVRLNAAITGSCQASIIWF